ncbi:hypothetical protein EI983_18795 [Roseovarius faecimaris]|uniref:Putative Flp pilus-assembly TadG-like N-terminal domain-containing protein n=1 Tax=Roseovarius faecimaris TaxID=2494550 RepID=A0A6I6ISJ8_9RHOB|nr:pilus assembly protein TadG-related protein [Roseovarius faecimaris]QGY00201.1 hypothetical protein EI983_18795 [Roseovarius faecimaris]
MRSFCRDRRGFVLVFALLVMPVFIGFAFIIIDIGRGNNAHADLAAAADAVALAGARELDGGPDAIDDAKAAMANVSNTVSMLVSTGTDVEIVLTYEDTSGNEFGVTFLTDIPEFDTTPIDAAWLTTYSTTDGEDAEYVYVQAQSRNLENVFFSPLNALSSIPIAATAVAKSTSAVCDIPPLYICNPFEFDASGQYVGDELQAAFARGDLHGRMVRLHPAGNDTHTPGNFGFLSVNDPDVNNGARAISDLFAGAPNGTCYEAGSVETKPGASNSIAAGINTRFDMYLSPYQNGGASGANGFTARTSRNVRKGIHPSSSGPNVDNCVTQGGSIPTSGGNAVVVGDDHVWDTNSGTFNLNGTIDPAYGLPDNLTMQSPNTDGSLGMNAGVAGAYIGSGAWDVQEYLDRNYGTNNVLASTITSSFPGADPSTYSGPGFTGPSRYDVYLWEQSSDNTTGFDYQYRTLGSTTGESGEALCTPGTVAPWDPDDPTTGPDPRVMVAAIVDCGTYSNNNGRTNFPVNAYANIFMTRPMINYAPSTDMTIDIEIIDITGVGGNGNLETFIRDEAILVR